MLRSVIDEMRTDLRLSTYELDGKNDTLLHPYDMKCRDDVAKNLEGTELSEALAKTPLYEPFAITSRAGVIYSTIVRDSIDEARHDVLIFLTLDEQLMNSSSGEIHTYTDPYEPGVIGKLYRKVILDHDSIESIDSMVIDK